MQDSEHSEACSGRSTRNLPRVINACRGLCLAAWVGVTATRGAGKHWGLSLDRPTPAAPAGWPHSAKPEHISPHQTVHLESRRSGNWVGLWVSWFLFFSSGSTENCMLTLFVTPFAMRAFPAVVWKEMMLRFPLATLWLGERQTPRKQAKIWPQ